MRGVTALVPLLAVGALIGGVACGGAREDGAVRSLPGTDVVSDPDDDGARGERRPRGADRFEVVLGEWAVTPEAETLRPGPVTFRITNRGSLTHGFEIESEDDHSGPGDGDGYKFETGLIEPGGSVDVRLDLAPGTYKIECLVEGHDDRGMEGSLHVRRGAPRDTDRSSVASDDGVSIEGFAFEPASLEVGAGTEVTWTNLDPAEHTVTGDGFGSDMLATGERFTSRFTQPGSFRYRCAIHPEMTARVTVTR